MRIILFSISLNPEINRISDGILIKNMILTTTCDKNGNKNKSPITVFECRYTCLLLQLVKKLKSEEVSRGDYGAESRLVFGNLHKVQAASPHGTCSGWLHFPVYYHRSLL